MTHYFEGWQGGTALTKVQTAFCGSRGKRFPTSSNPAAVTCRRCLVKLAKRQGAQPGKVIPHAE